LFSDGKGLIGKCQAQSRQGRIASCMLAKGLAVQSSRRRGDTRCSFLLHVEPMYYDCRIVEEDAVKLRQDVLDALVMPT